jgi:hypothetical protein
LGAIFDSCASSVTPELVIWGPVATDTAAGVRWRVVSRFSAVTTISVRLPPVEVGEADPGDEPELAVAA